MDSARAATYRVRRVLMAMTVGLFALVLRAQEDPLTWLRLQVGSSRRYEHEWKSGDRRRPKVEQWTTDERITEWVAVAEGLVVLHEMERHGTSGEQPVRVLGLDGQTHAASGSDGAYVIAREREPYLVRGECVYVIDNGFDTRAGNSGRITGDL